MADLVLLDDGSVRNRDELTRDSKVWEAPNCVVTEHEWRRGDVVVRKDTNITLLITPGLLTEQGQM